MPSSLFPALPPSLPVDSRKRLRIAVIGAGLAGLAAARALTDHHHAVTVFEKSRGMGWRAATRRAAEFDQQADHGAQYFTARDRCFRRQVLSWAERGVVERWHGRIGAYDGHRIAPGAFGSIVDAELPAIRWSQAHRWLYSLVDEPLDVGCLWDPALGIGACGDWCNGARIEGAWLSGEALAGRVLASS